MLEAGWSHRATSNDGGGTAADLSQGPAEARTASGRADQHLGDNRPGAPLARHHGVTHREKLERLIGAADDTLTDARAATYHKQGIIRSQFVISLYRPSAIGSL